MITTTNKKAKVPELIFQPKPLLHHYFRETVDRTPTKTAIVCGDSELTYEGLEQASNRLANHLRSLGCKPGVMVAVYLKRTINPYIAMLATVKAGGAYVPLDPMFPKDRVDYILADANVHIVITESELALKQQIRAPHVVMMDTQSRELNAQHPQTVDDIDLGTDHPAYAIYTSGSTGKPKGVLIEHHAASHFVASMLEVYGVTSEDKIYQGFSHCFDASVEEIWLSFATGATMYVGTDDVHKSAEAVAEFIDHHQVTVFSTVPTFLGAMVSPLHSVKTLVLGGESLRQEYVDKWAVPGRKMLNTYGPTEATVVATAAVCNQGEPVTIGQALPHYRTFVLDSNLKVVPQGCEGELCISGPVLARGYIGQPELTDKVFVANPYKQHASDSRLYRTGDLVRMNAVNNIEFIGRIDSQVKIRGYRVELAEIEAIINSVDEIQASVVKVVEVDQMQCIAAYVKCRESSNPINRSKFRDLLRSTLPKYMVPTYFEELDQIPVLPSGKTDLKALPAPEQKLTDSNREIVKPCTDLEIKLFDVCGKLFNTGEISIHDEFFDDIGGHSLLAANYAGNIRCELGYECMSIRDVFEYPTIALLADELNGREVTQFDASALPEVTKAEQQYNALSIFTKFAVPSFQAITIFAIYALFSAVLSMVYTVVTGFIDGFVSAAQLAGFIVALLFLTYPCLLLMAIAAKWLLVGRYKAGEYRLWGWFYLRWWIASLFLKISGFQLLCGSPLMNIFYRLMGAKIGSNVCLDTSACVAFDVVSIGADSSICGDTHILGYRVEEGLLKIGSVSVGERCFLGVHCAMGLDSQLGHDCRLEDFTAIDDDQVVAHGGQMSGSPAVESSVVLPTETVLKPTRARKLGALLCSAVAIYSFFSLFCIFGLGVVLGGILTYLHWGFGGTMAMLFLGAPFILFASSMVVVLVKLCVAPKSKAGIYRLHSVLYYRKWFVDLFLKTHRTLFIPMYATLFLPPFLRLLGAKLGKRCELSTIAQISPDLIEAGDECFYADAAIIGGKRIFGGYFQIDICKIGNRSFVGNSAMLPIGANIGDECLVGCLTLPPKNTQASEALPGQKWLGSPPILLSNTQTFEGFSEEELYRPSRITYAQRLIVDTIRILLPTYLTSLGIVVACFMLWQLPQYVSGLNYYLLLPLGILGIAALSLLVVIGLKKIIVGTFMPIVKPLWSPYVWFNEVVNALYEAVYTPAITLFCGTPFISPMLRGIGCRMGKRVYLDSTYFSEFDLAEVGDFVSINLGSTIQTHLFEDRVMKSSYLKIRKGASIGNMSVVLYDTDIKEGVKIKPFSLVMKGETLPAHSVWGGVPIMSRKQ